MKRFFLAFFATVLFASATIGYFVPPLGMINPQIELVKDVRGGNMRTCYLRWYGVQAELEIWEMQTMRIGGCHNVTVNCGDILKVYCPSYGWAEIYYGNNVVILQWYGEIEAFLLINEG